MVGIPSPSSGCFIHSWNTNRMMDINSAIVYINNNAQFFLSVFLTSVIAIWTPWFVWMSLLCCFDPCANHTMIAYIVRKRWL